MMGTMLFLLGVGFFILFIHYRWGDYGRDEAVNEVEDAVVEERTPNAYQTRTLVLHVKKHFLFIPQIPQLDGYLKGVLSLLFETVRSFDVNVEKIRLQECEK